MARAQLNDRAIRTWLEDRALTYEHPRSGIFLVPIPGAPDRKLRIGLAPTMGAAVFMMTLVVRMPEGRRRQAMDYLNQLNTEEPMGAWVINHETREIIFRAALPLTSSNPQDIWYMIRRVTTRVGGTSERRWALALGLRPLEQTDLPTWATDQ